jgi:tripartite-type tricarboxylate transporter receptor subunit TctC
MALSTRLIGAALLLLAATVAQAQTQARAQTQAQTWPNGPVKMFVGFPAGGTTDIIARDLGHELEKVWRHPVIIENRAGANGAIAAAQLARLPADGQTLMMVVSGHVTNPLTSSNAGYDAIRDFTPITLVASSPLLIFSNPQFQARSIKDLIELAKQKPGTISYATPGVASIQHLSMELMAHLTGAKFIHVPYRGGAPALNDVIAGHVPVCVMSVMQALPHLQTNRVRALAVTSAKAIDVLSNVPSVAEVGVKDYEAELWYVVIAPAGLPPAIAAKINADVTRIVKSPEFRKRLEVQGARPIGSTQAEVAAFLKAESEKWEKVIKAANIKG